MKNLILKALKRKTLKRAELLTYLRSKGVRVRDRRMRATIEEMIEDGIYIQSSEKGYTLCRKDADFVEARKYLRKKALAIFSRMAKLERGLRDLRQLKLNYK